MNRDLNYLFRSNEPVINTNYEKSKPKQNLWLNYNNIAINTRKAVDNQLHLPKNPYSASSTKHLLETFEDKSSRAFSKRFQGNYLSKKISSPYFSNNKPKKHRYSSSEKTLRKMTNKPIKIVNKAVKFFKENFFNPFFGEQYNVIQIIRGETIQRDFKKAQRDGELITSRIIGGNFQVTNPFREWSSNLLKYTTPETFQKSVHRRLVKNHDLWTIPFKKIFKFSQKSYDKALQRINPDSDLKKIRYEKSTKREAKRVRGNAVMAKVNRIRTFSPEIKELSLTPERSKVLNFVSKMAKKNKKIEEELQDAV